MRRRIWREREGFRRICRTAWGGGGHDDQNSLVPLLKTFLGIKE